MEPSEHRIQSLQEKPPITSTFIGHVIGSSFGLVFVLINSAPLMPALRVGVCLLAVVVFLTVVGGFVATLRTRRGGVDDGAGGFTGRFWIVVVVEAVLLVGGLAVVRMIEPAAALGWIALVVGVHFFPVSRLWAPGRVQIMAIAIAMTTLGVVGLILAFATHDADAVDVVSGVGSGVVLLGVAFVVALRTLTQQATTR
ncbi:hypothetical protein F6B41_20790 [Microbacterium lushaniae]|nr:hypothetical protein F6B41_33750 [Microbacterium lushaniae]KAA9151363.1 hypothetical protein F6B41_20790 [Microbacterium lushaniae]